MRKRKKIKKSLWEEYLNTLNNRESYISITIGFIAVVIVGTLVYRYLSDKIPKLTIPKKETIQEVLGQKTEESKRTYTVAKRERLWDIAVKFYGDGYTWTKIAKANNLTNPSTIHEGNILIIPE